MLIAHGTAHDGYEWRLEGALLHPLPRRYRFVRRRSRYHWIKASYPIFPNQSRIGSVVNKKIQQYVSMMYDRVTPDADFVRNPIGAFPWYLEMYNLVSMSYEGFISMYFNSDWYAGGATGTTETTVINVAIVNGKSREITISDLFHRTVDLQDLIQRRVEPRLYRAKVKHVGKEYAERTLIPVELWDSFVLTPTAIMWLFSPGEVGARAEPVYKIKLPYAALKGKLRLKIDASR